MLPVAGVDDIVRRKSDKLQLLSNIRPEDLPSRKVKNV